MGRLAAFAFHLACASVMLAPADAVGQHFVAVQGGTIVRGDREYALAQTAPSAVLVWSDRRFYLPGDTIVIRAMGLSADARDLEIRVSETFRNAFGDVEYSLSYSCDCGNGRITDLTNFGFTTIAEKKIPKGVAGSYEFTVLFLQRDASNVPREYQGTKVIASVLTSAPSLFEEIVISDVQKALGVGTFGSGPILILKGKFPVNTPFYYFVGAAPYSGIFTPQPQSADQLRDGTAVGVSRDGTTLVIQSVDQAVESRVILMTPDRRFSTTSAQSFVSLSAQ